MGMSSHYTANPEVNHLLYQKIWQPLEPYLEGVEKIYLSPDGYLHQVSFAGLIPNLATKKSLLNEYDFFYHSNLRDILFQDTSSNIGQSIFLMGNPNYNQPVASKKQKITDLSTPFPALKGTSKEISNIEKALSVNNFSIYKYQAATATEINFRKQITKQTPSIIHLATHGFFFKENMEIKQDSSLEKRIKGASNALLRSGLVFAGVNDNWLNKTKSEQLNLENDGILTALEVANLDLYGTKLAVLSACNTGKGEVKDGEGIFGLQRAFKVAGVSYLLYSLWEIPDVLTAELMQYFYESLAEGLHPRQALLKAQKKMSLKYPNPYNWAGFILYG